jgi:hypothetical protein
MKRMVIIIAMACFVVALSIQGALAGTWLNYCNVDRVGEGSGAVYVMLTDTGGTGVTNRWYTADPANQNVILATALTALSNGRQVQVLVNPNSSQYATISSMYIRESSNQ